MSPKVDFCTMFEAYVVAGDTSKDMGSPPHLSSRPWNYGPSLTSRYKKLPKISPSKSSLVNSPVISPKAC